ncbi:hypothetical protein GTY41_03575 [Streptomyces sp. SID685]|uniref:hypothetical protein n=1 Tax=Streptomyces sp. SID685 TaxID=2690322 RepID=UPI001369C7E9|nr:hypothetical protein [Streptomyces sp. SID685]MYR84045.1 hypothetical protein [Streptomyces sp. SID685]
MTQPRYTLTITCGRPSNRACDDFHVQPKYIVDAVKTFIGGDAELSLTARTARLTVADLSQLPNPKYWQQRMGEVLHCLWLDVPRIRGDYQLPSPVQFDIRETTA